jgi:hypothetical protein
VIRRIAALAVLSGLALPVPFASATYDPCGGLERCEGKVLLLVLDTKAEAEAAVAEHRPDLSEVHEPPQLPPVCIPDNGVFSRTCVL